MARVKRTSPSIDNARTRAATLASIGQPLDLGNGLTLEFLIRSIEAAAAKLANYNTKVSELNGLTNDLNAAEKDLAQLTSRMLAGVAAKFGRDSEEYAKAGGVRTSARSRSKHVAPAAAPAPAAKA